MGETVRTSGQALVGGRVVGLDIQEEFGLLTLGASGSCSASLLRNTWAITAAHCLEVKDTNGNPVPDPTRAGQNMLVPLTSVMLTANWGGVQRRQAAWMETFRPYDIAIIRVATPFMVRGSTDSYNREVFQDGQFPYFGHEVPVLVKVFGRGIHQFALRSGSTDTPAQMDGQFRVGWAKTRRETSGLYWYPSEGGQMIAGGDSGGPSFAWVHGGYVLMGVHALADVVCLPGRECGRWRGAAPVPLAYDPWEWVVATPEAADAPVEPVWEDIRRFIGAPPPSQEFALEPPPPGFIGTFARTPPGFQPFWLYSVQEDGVLLWYRKDSTPSPFQGPKQVGIGWDSFKRVVPAGGNGFFALTDDGLLKWYVHDGFNSGTPDWQGPVDVGNAWRFRHIFGGSDGVVYAIRDDGRLLWFKHQGIAPDRPGATSWKDPQIVGNGWQNFKDVFSTGNGSIYAVDPEGTLWLYEHEGFSTGEHKWKTWEKPGGVAALHRRRVGTGWLGFERLIPVGEGRILAVTAAGRLLHYHHKGFEIEQGGHLAAVPKYKELWEGPTDLGGGWHHFTQMFAALPASVSGVR